MEKHLEEIQSRLQKVPKYTEKVSKLRGTKLFYPADEIKLKYSTNIISKILSLGKIKSSYDFGCGTGLYVQELINQGIDTLGFDGNLGIENEIKTDEKNIVFTNLEYSLSKKYLPRDLVLSIEFAEHLSEEGGKLFCNVVTDLSNKWIVMTASSKPGEFHLNPQPKDYWITRIEEKKTHKYKKQLTNDFMEFFHNLILTKHGLNWFRKDLMIFKNIKERRL